MKRSNTTKMVSTTSIYALAPGTNVVITPASMTGITVGMLLVIGGENSGFTGKGEYASVNSKTSTTFKADLAHYHEAGAWINEDGGVPPNAVMWGT